MSGALDGCRAIAFGHCTGCAEEAGDVGGARTLDEVLAEFADQLAIPCVAGLPIGHIADQWTVPLGAMASLDARAGADPALVVQTH
jgi:muramoyltetrapeptide carboxypeptidase